VGLPLRKRGDRIKALHKIVDEVSVKMGLEGEFGGPSDIPDGLAKLVLAWYKGKLRAQRPSQ